jgi:dihydrofolate reductase
MRKLVVSTYVTLDGAIDDPHHWSFDFFDDDAAKLAHDLLFGADALLMGRKTYEGFAESWPGRGGEFADRFNALPKHVASTTLSGALPWNNARVLEGDLVTAVGELKRQDGADLLMYGTGPVAETLLAAGLLDEHHAWIHPVIWGKPGTRLFAGGLETTKLELAGTRTLGSGVVVLTHKPAAA